MGRPNVGKSTLVNRMVGQKIAIVSPKPQTTRGRILGIRTEGEDQLVLIDTPGVFSCRNPLGDYMVKTARSAVKDCDGAILVADAGFDPGDIERGLIGSFRKVGIPAVLALNKIDRIRRERLAQTIAAYAALHSFAAVVPVCAKSGKGVDELLEECARLLHEGDWIFEEDMMTDQSARQMAAEIIREKILRTVNREVPHGIAVVIEEFTEEPQLTSIRAEIFCEKESHKGILVGKNGETLKRIGSYARHDLERLLGTQVYLNLWVKVKESWRESLKDLRSFGYGEI